MALHVTNSKKLYEAQELTAEGTSTAFDTGAYIEGVIYLDGDVTAGTWTPKLQQRDPKFGTWMDRSDSFTAMNTTGGPEGDGLNQWEAVAISSLGSLVRLVLTPTGAPSPSLTISATFEGKT